MDVYTERQGVTELLGSDDIEIMTADTGASALLQLRDNSIDCVVLDLKLPDMSGFEVLERIRDDASLCDIPVVVFTGRELSPDGDSEAFALKTIAGSAKRVMLVGHEPIMGELSARLTARGSDFRAGLQKAMVVGLDPRKD